MSTTRKKDKFGHKWTCGEAAVDNRRQDMHVGWILIDRVDPMGDAEDREDIASPYSNFSSIELGVFKTRTCEIQQSRGHIDDCPIYGNTSRNTNPPWG